MVGRVSACRFAVLTVVLWAMIQGASLGATVPGEKDVLFGFDLDLLSQAFNQFTNLQTQYGEKEGNVHFAAWLKSQGRTQQQYDSAWNAWWQRFKADPTGKLAARFSQLNSKYSQQNNFGDVPSKKLETREGVTLDQYAKISVALSRPSGAGAKIDVDKVLRQNGIESQARWKRVNEAWAKAMHDDTSYALVQQYGALYQHYAGPAFEEEQQKQVAASLAAHNRLPPPPPSPPASPPSVADLFPKLAATAPAERWSAARQIALQCSLWAGPARKDPADPRSKACSPQALHEKLLPAILDAIDHHGDDTLNYGTNMLDFLGDLGLKDATVKSAVERAARRDQDRLTALEAAFAPIQNKAVPERVFLRAKIDGYQAAVKELKGALASW
jgi:hypothetical protein